MQMFNAGAKVALCMAQPMALPGSFKNNGETIGLITEKLLEEVAAFDAFGFDGVILQNFYDIPVKGASSIEAIAYMAILAAAIKREFPSLALGILMLWDGCASLAVADAAGADFIRVEHAYTGAEVTPAGIIEGQCVEVVQLKKKIGSKVPVFADVYEPHAVQIGASLHEDAAYETIYGCFADGIFLCGKNASESIGLAQRVRPRIPNSPIILGGGSTGDNVYELLQYFDGTCVGAWIKDGYLLNPVNPAKANAYMDEVKRAKDTANLNAGKGKCHV